MVSANGDRGDAAANRRYDDDARGVRQYRDFIHGSNNSQEFERGAETRPRPQYYERRSFSAPPKNDNSPREDERPNQARDAPYRRPQYRPVTYTTRLPPRTYIIRDAPLPEEPRFIRDRGPSQPYESYRENDYDRYRRPPPPRPRPYYSVDNLAPPPPRQPPPPRYSRSAYFRTERTPSPPPPPRRRPRDDSCSCERHSKRYSRSKRDSTLSPERRGKRRHRSLFSLLPTTVGAMLGGLAGSKIFPDKGHKTGTIGGAIAGALGAHTLFDGRSRRSRSWRKARSGDV